MFQLKRVPPNKMQNHENKPQTSSHDIRSPARILTPPHPKALTGQLVSETGGQPLVCPPNELGIFQLTQVRPQPSHFDTVLLQDTICLEMQKQQYNQHGVWRKSEDRK